MTWALDIINDMVCCFSQGNEETSPRKKTDVLQTKEKINPDLTLRVILWLLMQIHFINN